MMEPNPAAVPVVTTPPGVVTVIGPVLLHTPPLGVPTSVKVLFAQKLPVGAPACGLTVPGAYVILGTFGIALIVTL